MVTPLFDLLLVGGGVFELDEFVPEREETVVEELLSKELDEEGPVRRDMSEQSGVSSVDHKISTVLIRRTPDMLLKAH